MPSCFILSLIVGLSACQPSDRSLIYPAPTVMSTPAQLLTDPFLQLPTANAVRVVWFTEFAGTRHTVSYGTGLQQTVVAVTRPLTRVREDRDSRLPNGETIRAPQPVVRFVWRHEAEVTGLQPGERIPYRVTSQREDGATVSSEVFTLAASPSAGQPLKILLTSDHQLKPMTAANLQKVVETVGRVDAVFLAGDLVNIPDRASEWFDHADGNGFFPVLQGRGHYKLAGATYRGGAVIQHAPLFPAIGNHEVMGRYSLGQGLNAEFDDAVPRFAARQQYEQKAEALNPHRDPELKAAWIKQHSFNTDTYEQLFTLPQSQTGGETYYAVTFGDVRLVVLYATHIWRTPSLDANARGRFREREADFNQPHNWGYGQHIFAAIAPGSPQYNWLQAELQSSEFQAAKYKIVMLHHPPHSLGANVMPAFTDPVQVIERDAQGNIQAIRYEYPKAADYLIRDLEPLLEQAQVNLVFYGHTHIWNRFVSPQGMHFLETSNVGNSYGAYIGGDRRFVPPNYQEDYVATGDPNGLQPIIPTIAPLKDKTGQPLPYLSSNEITAFSILDTGTGTISSYYFDTRQPNSPVVKFDEFSLLAR